MKRREFIGQIAAWGSLAVLNPSQLWAKPIDVELTILHTNDMHSRIDPFPDNAPQYAGQGGMARRAALIAQLRRQIPNLLLFDSGDIFQGTPYFNFFGGEPELRLMSQMGYDAATLGNHEFDNGLDHLAAVLPQANFPFLIANYDFRHTPLADYFQPYKVFEKAGIRIGVFGLGIELHGLVNEHLYGRTRYLDAIGVAREIVQTLKKNERCQLIICLSHLGLFYADGKVSDIRLASHVPGIDIILGGHTHSFMDKPYIIPHADGSQTLIHQVGWAGVRLGRIDLRFKANGQKYLQAAGSLTIAPGQG